jgi:hypothetical protein
MKEKSKFLLKINLIWFSICYLLRCDSEHGVAQNSSGSYVTEDLCDEVMVTSLSIFATKIKGNV